MKIIGIPIPVFLFLFVAAILELNSSSTSISQYHIQFSSGPLFLFSLFNTIILAIIVGSYRPSAEEVDVALPCFQFPYEVGKDTNSRDEDDNNHDYDYDEYYDSDDYNEDDDGYYGSDGYDEDDDDNGSDDEIGWQDEEEEYDDNLEKRIEDFIAMVNNGWREERLQETRVKENLQNQCQY